MNYKRVLSLRLQFSTNACSLSGHTKLHSTIQRLGMILNVYRCHEYRLVTVDAHHAPSPATAQDDAETGRMIKG